MTRGSAFPVQDYASLLEELPPSVVTAALQAALSFHRPDRYEDWGGGYACQCRDKGGSRRLWPCPEVLAVIAVLSGEA